MANRWTRVPLALLLATAALLGGPAAARAAPEAADDSAARAKTLFANGRSEYNLGHYADALALFEQTYKLSPRPALLYNIAQCHRLLGNLEQARHLYQNFLNTADADNPSIPDAKRLVGELEQTLKAQAQSRAAPPTGLVVQDKPPLVPGSLERAAQGSAGARDARLESPTGSATASVPPAEKPRPSPAPAPVAAVTTPAEPPRRSHTARVVGWSLVGAGALAAAAGTVFGLGAKSSEGTWASATTPAAWQAGQSDATSKATDANIAWACAGVLGAAGLAALLIFDR